MPELVLGPRDPLCCLLLELSPGPGFEEPLGWSRVEGCCRVGSKEPLAWLRVGGCCGVGSRVPLGCRRLKLRRREKHPWLQQGSNAVQTSSRSSCCICWSVLTQLVVSN